VALQISRRREIAGSAPLPDLWCLELLDLTETGRSMGQRQRLVAPWLPHYEAYTTWLPPQYPQRVAGEIASAYTPCAVCRKPGCSSSLSSLTGQRRALIRHEIKGCRLPYHWDVTLHPDADVQLINMRRHNGFLQMPVMPCRLLLIPRASSDLTCNSHSRSYG
jgi:hypothetical protein